MSSAFLHCNQCYCQPNREVDFFFTSCGHILCHSCVSNAANGNGLCFVCKSRFDRVKLSADMNPEIKAYFADPQILWKKAAKVSEFQRSQLSRCLSSSKIEAKKLKAENIRMQKKLEQVVNLLNQKDKELKLFKTNANAIIRSRGFSASQPMFPAQPTEVKSEPDVEFVSYGRQRPTSMSGMYSQPAHPRSQQLYGNVSRMSLNPIQSQPLRGYYSQYTTPSTVNMKSMSADSAGSYFSAHSGQRSLKKSATVSPFSL